jgi:uncharacterized protein YecE (DUF72 family)
MDFGKLADISNVDFSLPENPALTQTMLAKWKGTGTLYLGTTAWADRQFLGSMYPKSTKPSAFLSTYANQFNTVELNATHYAIPQAAQLTKWRESVPQGFKFCPKLPQLISHRDDFGMLSGSLAAYIDSIRHLDTALGLQYLQLPPQFEPSKTPQLISFLKKWPTDMPLAIEFRHPDWFVENKVWHILADHNIGTVITDVGGRRDVCHMQLTAPFVMLRFVGNGLHATDFERATAWVHRLKEWAKSSLDIYFMVHEPDIPQLTPMSVDFSTKLTEAGFDVQKVKSYEAGEQTSLF